MIKIKKKKQQKIANVTIFMFFHIIPYFPGCCENPDSQSWWTRESDEEMTDISTYMHMMWFFNICRLDLWKRPVENSDVQQQVDG